MSEPAVRDPRNEAEARLPSGYEARVLEPSPPANQDPDWYADDPTDAEGAAGPVVTPIEGEGVSWAQLTRERPELAAFASDHWLGALRSLEPLPETYDTTRNALHQVAFFAVSPKRYTATGRLGLRYTHGGFGTPFYGEDEQTRVEGSLLVRQQGRQVTWTRLTTLSEACEFLGIPYRETWFENFHDPLSPAGADMELEVSDDAATALADWFGFATHALEQARRTPGAVDVSRVQLWPEHFDPAFEMGSYDKGHRASYGASPGDDDHLGPYLYVSPWSPVDADDPYWNDTSFGGASLSYKELLEADDQIGTAVEFYRQGFRSLTGASG